jgi:uncharacterized membrane protein
MKIEYNIKNISGKNKSLCIGDLVKYYGETRYKLIESIQRLNKDNTTKSMVANILKKAMNNPNVEMMFDNMEELSKKNIFSFQIDDINPIVFDNGKDNCKIIITMNDEYFAAKAIYDMMKPGFHKKEYKDYIKDEKEEWKKWFTKNLKEYTNDYSCIILEE